MVACGVPRPMLAVPLTGTWTGAPSARNCVPSAGLSMLTWSAAPFGRVVLLEPAHAGRAATSATNPRTAIRRAPRKVFVFPFTEYFPLTSGWWCRRSRRAAAWLDTFPTSRAAYITSPSSPPGHRAPAGEADRAAPASIHGRSGGKCLHRVNFRRRSFERIRCRGDPRVRRANRSCSSSRSWSRLPPC